MRLGEYSLPLVGYVAISCGIPLEIVVITLTWIKTIPTIRLLRHTDPNFFPTLVYVIYRDGTLSFITILVLSVIALLSYVWQPFFCITMLSNTLVSIIVSRFMLNLREDHVRTTGGVEQNCSLHIADLSHIHFDLDILPQVSRNSSSATSYSLE
ncbi:hypothetical protein BDY19DRAFT_619996 [Irpex rosettiformis]|uniref:Uncharacterized protein n=1 Tax=Irpex rosettiformis TaxID=378272 RepID=A0ACB8TNT7_9APHY|nr:hypothetical protein BDY19DRAFT_619996 [Irpex rosettiformis]